MRHWGLLWLLVLASLSEDAWSSGGDLKENDPTDGWSKEGPVWQTNFPPGFSSLPPSSMECGSAQRPFSPDPDDGLLWRKKS